MEITTLQIDCQPDGEAKITLWAKAKTPDDVDDLVTWLGLARHVMTEWLVIRTMHQHIVETGNGNVTAINKKKGLTDESK